MSGGRSFLTGLLVGLYVLFLIFVQPFNYIGRADQAAQQLSADSAVHLEAVQAAQMDMRLTVATVVLVILLLMIWMRPILTFFHGKKWSVGTFAMLFILVGCTTKTDIKTIEANQTAFLIPIAGDTSTQTKFQSVDFLKGKQVAAKQVEIPYEWKQTGGNGVFKSGDFYPTVKLYLVNRAPVTREWTDAEATGTTTSNQAFAVESSESVGFQVGATCTAMISEADAAVYLYWFGEKPLEQVMDENIRGVVQKELFNAFAKTNLAGGQVTKQDIYAALEVKLKEDFAQQGITIVSFGGQGGLWYDEQMIQDSINNSYAAQQGVFQTQAKATQQFVINEQMISQANAAATATVIAGQAAAQVQALNGEMLDKYPGITAYTAAQKWNGQLPQYSGGNGSMPFGLLVAPQPTPTLAP